MIRAFVDASVLFAAAHSSTGASREIIRLAIREQVQLVCSQFAYNEARKNLLLKAPEVVADLETFWDTVDFEIVRPSKQDVEDAMRYTADKDAPIVAAGKAAAVDYLVTLDKTHLLDKPEVAQGSGLKIVTPGDLLEEIRKLTNST